MVVSSVTPLTSAAMVVQRFGSVSYGATQDAQDFLVLVVVRGVGRRHRAGLLELDALVQQEGGVAAVVEDHVRGLAVGPDEDLLGEVPVLRQRLALPGEDGDALRVVDGAVPAHDDRGGRVVLGGEDVAAGPAHVGAQVDQGLDEDRRLDGHVQRAGDAGTREGLVGAVALAHGHESRHLVLGERDLGSAVLGQGQVSDVEIHCAIVPGSSSCSAPRPDRTRPGRVAPSAGPGVRCPVMP